MPWGPVRLYRGRPNPCRLCISQKLKPVGNDQRGALADEIFNIFMLTMKAGDPRQTRFCHILGCVTWGIFLNLSESWVLV